MMRTILAGLLAFAASLAARATPVFSEGFDDVSGLGAAGWVQTNNSTPVGATGWFQGNSGVFAAQSGSADSYIGANVLNAGAGGNVDNWLITPQIAFATGDVISFFTRTNGAFPGDNLELLFSTGSTNIADFTSLALIASGSYPTDWSEFAYIYTGQASALRLAFRYRVTDTSVNGDYIGIDSVVVNTVPEPRTLALLGAGMLLVPFVIRRKRVTGATVGVASSLAIAAMASTASAADNVTDPATLPKFEHVVVVNLAAKQPSRPVKSPAPATQAGMRAYIDPVTKQLRQPTGEELAQQAAASKSALARTLTSTAVTDESGVDYSSAATHRPDGSVSVKVGDELMSYEVAHIAPDGSVTHECVGPQPNEKAALQAKTKERSHEK
jgi:Cleaved Adhesin Domain